MRGLTGKAEALHKARKEVDVIKKRHERELDAHFARISKLKGEVLSGLAVLGLSSVKVKSGDAYAKTKRKTYEIANPIAFDGWARDNRLVRVDREMARQRLQQLAGKGKLPAFAKEKIVDTIAFRSKPTKKKPAPAEETI